MLNVVATGIIMDDICPQNQPPRGLRDEAIIHRAQKINDESHYMIMDEIIRRDRLEYDPTRVLAGW